MAAPLLTAQLPPRPAESSRAGASRAGASRAEGSRAEACPTGQRASTTAATAQRLRRERAELGRDRSSRPTRVSSATAVRLLSSCSRSLPVLRQVSGTPGPGRPFLSSSPVVESCGPLSGRSGTPLRRRRRRSPPADRDRPGDVRPVGPADRDRASRRGWPATARPPTSGGVCGVKVAEVLARYGSSVTEDEVAEGVSGRPVGNQSESLTTPCLRRIPVRAALWAQPAVPCIARQREGTASPPVAWDRARSASSVDVWSMAAGGETVKPAGDVGWVAARLRAQGWVSGVAGSCLDRGRARRLSTGAGPWRIWFYWGRLDHPRQPGLADPAPCWK